MNRGVALSLLLGMSLFLAAACSPALGPEDSASPPDQPVAQAEEPAETAPAATSAPAAPDVDDSDVELDAGDAVTVAQSLDWGADDGNCIVPGLVITGEHADVAPCDDAEGSAPAAAPEEKDETAKTEEDAMPEEPMPEESAQPQAQTEYAAEMTALAVEDLAQRLGIPADQIEVREVRAVTWPDSSLGCPQPDMMYAQMLTEGLLIRLSADGEMYFYHSGGNQPPFLCEETMQMLPQDPLKSDEFVPPPGSEIDTQQTD